MPQVIVHLDEKENKIVETVAANGKISKHDAIKKAINAYEIPAEPAVEEEQQPEPEVEEEPEQVVEEEEPQEEVQETQEEEERERVPEE